MPQLAEPQALSVKVGLVVVISAPSDHAPANLDWSRWVLNTALRFERFEARAPGRVLLVARAERAADLNSVYESEFSRRDLQSVDPMALLTEQSGGHLMVTCGSWNFAVSSWVESLKQIAHAKYTSHIPTFLEHQFNEWMKLSSDYRDESLFVLSDSAVKFVNAATFCQQWIQRILRSRLIQESKQGAWSAGVMRLFDDKDHDGIKIRVQRLVTLNPTDWCGDASWESDLDRTLLAKLSEASEIWISVPYAGLTLDILDRLKAVGLSASIRLHAPSVIVGWHPIRDFMLFLGSKSTKRLFVLMDALERLQFICADNVTEASV